MSFSKQAHEAALAKVAAADRVEAEHAIDVGFALGCQKMGLSQEQTQKLAKIATARIEEAQKKVAAESAKAPTGLEPEKPAPGTAKPVAPVKPGTVQGKSQK